MPPSDTSNRRHSKTRQDPDRGRCRWADPPPSRSRSRPKKESSPPPPPPPRQRDSRPSKPSRPTSTSRSKHQEKKEVSDGEERTHRSRPTRSGGGRSDRAPPPPPPPSGKGGHEAAELRPRGRQRVIHATKVHVSVKRTRGRSVNNNNYVDNGNSPLPPEDANAAKSPQQPSKSQQRHPGKGRPSSNQRARSSGRDGRDLPGGNGAGSVASLGRSASHASSPPQVAADQQQHPRGQGECQPSNNPSYDSNHPRRRNTSAAAERVDWLLEEAKSSCFQSNANTNEARINSSASLVLASSIKSSLSVVSSSPAVSKHGRSKAKSFCFQSNANKNETYINSSVSLVSASSIKSSSSVVSSSPAVSKHGRSKAKSFCFQSNANKNEAYINPSASLVSASSIKSSSSVVSSPPAVSKHERIKKMETKKKVGNFLSKLRRRSRSRSADCRPKKEIDPWFDDDVQGASKYFNKVSVRSGVSSRSGRGKVVSSGDTLNASHASRERRRSSDRGQTRKTDIEPCLNNSADAALGINAKHSASASESGGVSVNTHKTDCSTPPPPPPRPPPPRTFTRQVFRSINSSAQSAIVPIGNKDNGLDRRQKVSPAGCKNQENSPGGKASTPLGNCAPPPPWLRSELGRSFPDLSSFSNSLLNQRSPPPPPPRRVTADHGQSRSLLLNASHASLNNTHCSIPMSSGVVPVTPPNNAFDPVISQNKIVLASISKPPPSNASRRLSLKDRPEKAPPVYNMGYTDPYGDYGIYSGEVDGESRPHGKGKMKYDNGIFYDGKWIHGRKDETRGCAADHATNMTRERILSGFTSWKGAKKQDGDPSSNGGTFVYGMAWVDHAGMSGKYTGHVNADEIPDGKGVMRYDFGLVAEGDWIKGKLNDGAGGGMSSGVGAQTVVGGGMTVAPGMAVAGDAATFVSGLGMMSIGGTPGGMMMGGYPCPNGVRNSQYINVPLPMSHPAGGMMRGAHLAHNCQQQQPGMMNHLAAATGGGGGNVPTNIIGEER